MARIVDKSLDRAFVQEGVDFSFKELQRCSPEGSSIQSYGEITAKHVLAFPDEGISSFFFNIFLFF